MNSMKITISFLIFLFFTTHSIGQASNILKFQRIDFERFQKAFFKIEANPYLHISEQTLQSNFQKLREDLRSPLSPLEQYQKYAAFLAKIQCGHTSLSPSNAVIKEWGRANQCLPFDVVLVNKKLFAAATHPDDLILQTKNQKTTLKSSKAKNTIVGGTEIYSIDHKNISEWMALISPYVSSDENGIDFKYYNASQLFDFYRYLANPTKKDSIEIEYIIKRDTLSKFVKLQHPLVNTIKARFGNDKLAMKLKEFGSFSIEKNKYGYFRFESFQFSKGLKYDAFLQKSFESMKKKKIDQLIIDLRGNTGGVIQVEILRYLLPEGTDIGSYNFEKQISKRELRKLGVKMHSWTSKVYLKNLKALKRADKRNLDANGPLKVGKNYSEKFKGNIVVITDEGTFSAASILACHLKTLAKAKIVGTTAGGSFYAGNAGTLELVLKKSKLNIQLNPNFFSTQLYPSAKIDLEIKKPDLETFSETEIPTEKFESFPKKVKPTDDPVIKQAEKLLK
jgi:hypothetical protein